MAGVLLYDADCGFCTRAALAVPKLRLAIGVCALQSVDLPALGVDPARAGREIPFVAASGAVSYGHLAIAGALSTGPLPTRLVGSVLRTPGLSRIFGALYALIAANRHRLPGGTPACKI
jgi:predicted DCC family thiol-disulfide oxidoreductase YuxK